MIPIHIKHIPFAIHIEDAAIHLHSSETSCPDDAWRTLCFQITMRFAALIIVVAIIYIVSARFNPANSVAEAMKEADAVTPQVSAQTTIQKGPRSSPSLRTPLDRTRAVLEKVKHRNGDGEF
jgi:hypothetical protein